MSERDNTHRLPLAHRVFSFLYRNSQQRADGRRIPRQSYREWLRDHQRALASFASFERDLWLLVSGRFKARLRKLDEVRIASTMAKEDSIRGETLVDQLTCPVGYATIRLSDIRMAHSLALDRVPSQRAKYDARCAALRAWKEEKQARFLSAEELARIIPSSDPIIVTRDPLGKAPYVAATGNGRLAALQAALDPYDYIEVICYLR